MRSQGLSGVLLLLITLVLLLSFAAVWVGVLMVLSVIER